MTIKEYLESKGFKSYYKGPAAKVWKRRYNKEIFDYLRENGYYPFRDTEKAPPHKGISVMMVTICTDKENEFLIKSV